MIKQLLKEALSEEKFKKFVYNKIVKDYYMYIGNDRLQSEVMFINKETKRIYDKGDIAYRLYENIGAKHFKIINIVCEIEKKVYKLLNEYNKKIGYTNKLDLYGNEPRFINILDKTN